MKLSAVIKRCSFYIGNDSGVTHLAALTGIKTVAIYSTTDPVVWSPIGENITVVKKNCLKDIEIEDVISHIFFLIRSPLFYATKSFGMLLIFFAPTI